jgi:imidazolonepropionase-like amidohydrolase
LLNLFSDYGIPIVAGTDNEGTIPDEIQTYVQLAMSPLNALRAATVVPSEIMGATQQSGSLEKGKNGDLLILDENPLTNMSTLKKINTVIKGQYVVRP